MGLLFVVLKFLFIKNICIPEQRREEQVDRKYLFGLFLVEAPS